MKELNRSPYIGFNGTVSSSEQSWARTRSFNQTPELRTILANGYSLLFGTQVSEKTQILEIENKYGKKWYPVGASLERALSGVYPIDNVLHVNCDSTEPDYVGLFAKFVYERAVGIGTDETDLGTVYYVLENDVDGFQFNRLPWHKQDYTNVFERLQKTCRISRLILQASNLQLDSLSPQQLATEAHKYRDVVSNVLLDGSSGTGMPLDVQQLAPYITELQSRGISVGIAGGLSAETVRTLAAPLFFEFKDISLDAESGLRDNYLSSEPSISSFSPAKAAAFARAIGKIMDAHHLLSTVNNSLLKSEAGGQSPETL